jgi:sugar/nucleoside kinase (ribokinase family)
MKVLCVGEMVVDILVHPVGEVTFANDSSIVDSVTITSGGDAMNNAINLARLGNDVTYAGRVGNDVLALFLVDLAANEGVNMNHVVYSKETPQTKSIILVNKDRDREFFFFPGVSQEFSFSDIDLSLLDDCECVQIGGTYHLPRFDGEETAKLLHFAHTKGVITSLDICKSFAGTWNIIDPCFPQLDYFIPSIEQAACIAGTADPRQMARYFLNRGARHVAIKLGEKGCYYRDRKTAFFCTPFAVPVAETTGAGDAFVAGFLTALGKGYDIEYSIFMASAASAFAIQSIGSTTGMKDFETLRRFVEERKEEIEVTYDSE